MAGEIEIPDSHGLQTDTQLWDADGFAPNRKECVWLAGQMERTPAVRYTTPPTSKQHSWLPSSWPPIVTVGEVSGRVLDGPLLIGQARLEDRDTD